MPADQRPGGFVHGLGIERWLHAPGAAALQSQGGPPVDDAIAIVPGGGAVSGVEIVRGALDLENRDRTGNEMRVQPFAEPKRIPVALKVDVRDLAHRMYARIGAAGPVHAGALAAKGEKRVFQHFLDRDAVRLPLPADKRAAVVFESELVARHAVRGAGGGRNQGAGRPRSRAIQKRLERRPGLASRPQAPYMSRNRHDGGELSAVGGEFLPLAPGSPMASHVAAQVANFTLANGLEVVVIPDHRAPVVTHMIWYRNGAADDPPGKSGIAHFLEHLMFKGTKAHPKGEFSEFISEIGGQENAFTSSDFTAYFQQVARQHLRACMAFEADRMTGLVLTDEVVAPERDVVLEERRMHADTDPGAQLGEAVQATLFTHHPYGVPIIGWGHEIEGLKREDALAYYQRFYTPENAIVVVAGDAEPDEALALAEETYGKVKPRGAKLERIRPVEPPTVADRLVTVKDEKVEQPNWQRHYLAPSCRTAKPGEWEALEVLGHLLGGGQTSFLYRRLVMEEKLAVSVWAFYHGTALDQSRFIVMITPAPGVTLETLDKAFDRALADFLREGVDEAALERSKTRLVADATYARDSQSDLARWYGSSLAVGQSLSEVEGWPTKIDAVDAEAVMAAARRWLEHKPAVTGHLLPLEEEAA